jgi:hypothetical protein
MPSGVLAVTIGDGSQLDGIPGSFITRIVYTKLCIMKMK